MSHLEKEDNQERELCVEKKIKGENKVLPPLRKIISVCESKENKRDFFFNREPYTRIIVIDLIIVKLLSLSLSFSLQRERIFHVNLCSCVWLFFLNC